MPVRANITATDKCAECGEPVEYRKTQGQYLPGEYQHVTGAPGHRFSFVYPARVCGDCGGPITEWQDPWANYTGCKACGTETRFGLGD